MEIIKADNLKNFVDSFDNFLFDCDGKSLENANYVFKNKTKIMINLFFDHDTVY
jgi:hypothetical protein